ncbi:MAG TPA: tRNA lysidine(34) synthetase TilS [Bacteroidales bacterium]|nr:tRNA lysidine(34) synthetase TilS [Bacteroidales bacterium]
MYNQNEIIRRFQEYASSLVPELQKKRVLLAVSGGMDSMAMAWLFSQSSIYFAVAHCNFSLRGEASVQDSILVKDMAQEFSVPFFCTTFNTSDQSKLLGMSIQETARHLRYSWLKQLADENHFDFIATGHHLDDSIETAFINLLRGTGVKGLAGIPAINGKIIRPLLFATRDEIELLVQNCNIPFRTDASNHSDVYLRNNLRNNIIPLLKNLRQGYYGTMKSFLQRMQSTADVLDKFTQAIIAESVTTTKEGITININNLLQHGHSELLLYEILKDYNFHPQVCGQLFQTLSGQPGKMFGSTTHTAIKDREEIFVLPKAAVIEQSVYYIEESLTVVDVGGNVFRLELIENKEAIAFDKSNQTAYFDADRLAFPLTLRKTAIGDSFVPLGMKGRKKVSDLLVERKVPLHRKKEVWVLLSGESIVWIAGFQTSQVACIAPNTQRVFKASWLPESK